MGRRLPASLFPTDPNGDLRQVPFHGTALLTVLYLQFREMIDGIIRSTLPSHAVQFTFPQNGGVSEVGPLPRLEVRFLAVTLSTAVVG